MKKSSRFQIANVEILFVSAIATILITRFFLHLTNYPQFGGGGLHIAHMLWGGFLMLGSIILMLSTLREFTFRIASLFSGIGFGLFIDEIGKFVTSNNNYFFEPTISIIYVVFILLAFMVRFAMKFSRRNMDTAIGNIEDSIEGKFGFIQMIVHQLQERYRAFLSHPWFTRIVVAFFLVYSLFQLRRSLDVLLLFFKLNEFSLTFIELGQFFSAVLSAVLVIAGIIAIRISRTFAFGLFQDAIYISIFLTQFFDFYNNELGALVALIVNLIIFAMLRYAIDHGVRVQHT